MSSTLHPSLRSAIAAEFALKPGKVEQEQNAVDDERQSPGIVNRGTVTLTPDTSRDELRTYLRTGEGRSSSMGDTSAFLVPAQTLAELVEDIYDESPIYANARVFKLESGKAPVLDLPVKSETAAVESGRL